MCVASKTNCLEGFPSGVEGKSVCFRVTRIEITSTLSTTFKSDRIFLVRFGGIGKASLVEPWSVRILARSTR